VDTLIIIPNQYLLKVVENNTPIKQAFLMADEVLYMGVQGISELITEPGEINIDFADVRTVMKGKGDALMGIGFGEGANRAVDAARQAISNPLLENASIEGAKSVLVNLAGSDTLTLQEYQDVVELVTERCADDALVIAGQAFNPELGDRIKVTVVATGFERKEDVVGAELADMDMVKRRYAASAKRDDGKNEEALQPARKNEEQPDIASNQGNRGQDLQKQPGKGPPTNANDYNIPAVLRYSRNKADDN